MLKECNWFKLIDVMVVVVVWGDVWSVVVDVFVVSLVVKSWGYNGMDVFCVSNRKVNRLIYMYFM